MEEKGKEVRKMKVDEDVREWLVENLTDWLDNLYDIMKHWIGKMGKAKSVEDIMRYKKAMLVDYMDGMPAGPDQCYFCLLHRMDGCEACEYGVIHGFCGDDGSDYGEISRLRDRLRQVLEERYYRDESYGED